MWIIKNRRIFYAFSTLLIGFSIFSILFWGIKFGIDFTGGSIIEFEFIDSKIAREELVEKITEFNNQNDLVLADFSLRETGEKGYIIRTAEIDNSLKQNLLNTVNEIAPAEEIRFNTIGPVLGSELKNKALFAVGTVALFIVLFVAYAFRHVSKPVSSWKYGFVAIIAFLHDVLVPVGLFALLGRFGNIEVDTLFVVSILVVLGYSINDTIVVFDRIRENLAKYPDKKRADNFEKVVGKSLKQTFSRSINTSITTLIALLAIFFLGGESTKYFSLALIAGVVAGTYSSIFFASPMLVTLQKLQKTKKVAVEK